VKGTLSYADVEKQWDYLEATAVEAAQARANRRYIEEYRKSLKALIMGEYKSESVAAQEREAYSDPRYIKHLKALETAVFEDAKFEFKRDAAKIKVSAWQTLSKTSI
jgi:hypothetical protein